MGNEFKVGQLYKIFKKRSRKLAIGVVVTLITSIALNVYLIRDITSPLPTIDKEAIRAEIERDGVWAVTARAMQPRPKWKKTPECDAYKAFEKNRSGIPPEMLENIKTIIGWAMVEMKTAQREVWLLKKRQRLTKDRMLKAWVGRRRRRVGK